MDKNQTIGLILMSLLVLVYFLWFTPEQQVVPEQQEQQQEQVEQQNHQQTNKVQEQNTVASLEPALSDSAMQVQQQMKYGVFSIAAEGEEKEVVLSNNDIEVVFSNKGGSFKEVTLKNYLSYLKDPLVILDENSSQMNSVLNTNAGAVKLNDLYFSVSESKKSDTSTVSFKISVDANNYIEQVYSLPPNGFQLMYAIKIQGLSQYVTSDELKVDWTNAMKRLESNIEQSRRNATINFYDDEQGFDDISASSTDDEVEEPGKAGWIAFKQRFFTSAIISTSNIGNITLRTSIPEEDTMVIKNTSAAFTVKTGENPIRFYFGPNNYQVMKKVTDGFSKNVYLGWPFISWFNKWLIVPIFNFLENYISNYGLIIIILVFIIKILLSPLSYRSYISMAKMKVINGLIKPQLDAFKEKNGDDMQKVQQEQMRLMQELGISPMASMSGCVPLLLQMPILLAMFNFFPNSIELRQESFLWAHDLSTYDSILDLPFSIPWYGDHVSLFTILMTGSTILMTRMNSQMTTVQGPMKSMQYMMPVMMMFFLNSFAAGLTFYYFVANIVTYGQQAIIKKFFIDEEKIEKKVYDQKQRNKGKKKSAFQQRLEEAMKAREEQTQQAPKKKKKGSGRR